MREGSRSLEIMGEHGGSPQLGDALRCYAERRGYVYVQLYMYTCCCILRSSPLRLGGMCSRGLRTFLPQILAQTSLSGLYNGDAGQVIDPPPCVGGQRTRTEEITRRH